MQLFADGLRAGGYVDQATNLYLKLVEFGADRSQQAGALKQCLACFGHEQGFYDRAAVPRLAAFVESQQVGPGAGGVRGPCHALAAFVCVL